MTASLSGLQNLVAHSGSLVYVYVGDTDRVRVLGAPDDDNEAMTPLVNATRSLTDNVARAVRHLGMAEWEAVSIECEAGVVAIARLEPETAVAVVSTPQDVPVGLTQRIAARAAQLQPGAAG